MALSDLTKKPSSELMALCATLVICCATLYHYSYDFHRGLSEADLPVLEVTGALIIAGAAYLAIVWQVVARQLTINRILAAVLIGTGLTCRIIMMASAPIKENDMYRYILDGNLTRHGINPYAVQPNQIFAPSLFENPATTAARMMVNQYPTAPELVLKVNNPQFRTIYPPLTQAFFALSQSLTPWSTAAWRVLLLVADVITAVLLLLLLKHLHLARQWSLIYWLNPVLFKEFYNSLHMDVLVFPFMMGATLLILHQRRAGAAGLIALAAGIKFWPAILLPGFLIYKARSWRHVLLPTIVFLGLFGAIVSPMLLAPVDRYTGVVAYANFWIMNDALFHLIAQFIATTDALDKLNTLRATKALFAALTLGWVIYVLRQKARDDHQVIAQAALILFGMFVFLPTQFPWYYAWLTPWLVLRPTASMLTYACLIQIYYLRFYFQARGLHQWFDNYVVWLEHLPVYGLILWEFKQRRWYVPSSPQLLTRS